MPPQKHNIFGFFLYTFVVLSAIAIFINSCCVQCPKCRCWNNKIIFRSKHRRLQPVRFFKNPPEIMQSYRVLQDTHYYILLTVGTGISVFWAIQKWIKWDSDPNLLCSIFVLFSIAVIRSEGAGWYDSQVTIWSHRTSTFQEIISRWILRIPPLIHVFVSFKTWAYGTHHILW